MFDANTVKIKPFPTVAGLPKSLKFENTNYKLKGVIEHYGKSIIDSICFL